MFGRPPRSPLFPSTTLFRSEPPARVAAGVAADLDRLCMDLLQRDPAARPTGREVLARLGAPHGNGPTTRVAPAGDRKSTRLNSSHGYTSYAVYCLKKQINYR